MPKRSSKPKRGDINQLAKAIVDQSTNDEPEPEPDRELTDDEKRSMAAKLLGSLGGKKGGPARAKALSKKKRSEIAKRAASARWQKKRGSK